MPLVSGKLRTSLFRVPFVAEQSFILLTIAPNGPQACRRPHFHKLKLKR